MSNAARFPPLLAFIPLGALHLTESVHPRRKSSQQCRSARQRCSHSHGDATRTSGGITITFRNFSLRGRSQIRPDSEIRPDLVEWGVNGRLTSYATSHVESVTFPSSHREQFVRGARARPVGPAGPASQREASLLFECQSHTSGRITLARPRLGGRLGVRRRHRPAPLRQS